MSLKIAVEGEEGFSETEGGILAPTADVLKHEAWLKDDWKRLGRMSRVCAERKVDIMLICTVCQEKNKQGLIELSTNEMGQTVLTCNCTERVVRV